MTSSRWSRGRIARTILRFCSTRLARRRSRSRSCGRIIRVCSSASRHVSHSLLFFLHLHLLQNNSNYVDSINYRLRRDRLHGTSARASLDADVPRDGHHADRLDCAYLHPSIPYAMTCIPLLIFLFLTYTGYMRSRPVRLPPTLPGDRPRAG